MKLMVEFDSDGVQYPNIAAAILRSGVMVNVERALIDGDEGWALLDVDDRDAGKFIAALTRKGVSIRIQKDAVSHNRTDCVDCGLSASVKNRCSPLMKTGSSSSNRTGVSSAADVRPTARSVP